MLMILLLNFLFTSYLESFPFFHLLSPWGSNSVRW